MNRKEKYEAKARAYEIVIQHIARMHENGGYEDESVVTVDELSKIVVLLEKKMNRKIEIGNTPPKPRAKKAPVSPIKVQPKGDTVIEIQGFEPTTHTKTRRERNR